MNKKLFENIETPFFFFDKNILSKEINTINEVIEKYWPNSIIAYSVKTNSLPYLGSYLKKKGISAEVVSEDEFNLVKKVGFCFDKIVCNGPIKGEKWINEILENDIILNIDSKRESDFIIDYAKLNINKKIKTGIRVNVDIESVFPYESTAGTYGSRFGFSNNNEELSNIINKLKSQSNIIISGSHLHISTKTRSVAIYRWLCQEFATLVHEYNLTNIEYFDIGGSFYGGVPNQPGWEEYIYSIAEELKMLSFSPNKLQLIIEPGVSLLAGCFSYCTKILDIKQIGSKKILLLDGSRTHIDPFFHKQSYFYDIERIKPPISQELVVQEFVGFTCLEKDRFFSIETEPLLQDNDLIWFRKLGAYTLSLSPLFISFFPAVYTKEKSGKIECVRKKWSTDEFVQGSKI